MLSPAETVRRAMQPSYAEGPSHVSDAIDQLSTNQAQLLAKWLARAGRKLNPGFPPCIETEYLAESAAERLRAMKLSTVTGCVTGIIMAPFFWWLMPDIHTPMLMLWVGTALPIAWLCHATLWSRLPFAWQEWQVALSGLAVGACFSRIMALSTFAHPSIYLGGMVLLILVDAIGGALRFRPVLLLVLGQMALFIATVPVLPAISRATSATLIILMLNIAAYALFGNWRLETEIRRSYALALRERVARQDLARHNVELDDLAGRDALTNLANRRTYDRWLQSHWTRAMNRGTAVGLVIIDIDYFKAFNDYYGHAAGDGCLQAVASCMREQSRGLSDQLARVGGEEFAVLLPGLDLETCGDVAERLRAAVAAMELPHLGAPQLGTVTISCGVASVVACGDATAATLFAAADAALYAAKQAGRNCVRLGEGRHAGEAALG